MKQNKDTDKKQDINDQDQKASSVNKNVSQQDEQDDGISNNEEDPDKLGVIGYGMHYKF